MHRFNFPNLVDGEKRCRIGPNKQDFLTDKSIDEEVDTEGEPEEEDLEQDTKDKAKEEQGTVDDSSGTSDGVERYVAQEA